MTNLVVRRRNPVKAVNPWREMDRIFEDFNKAWDDVPRKPVVRIDNQEDKVVLVSELPGFSADDIDIQVKENLLTIQAIEKKGKKDKENKVVFERSFVLPEDLQTEKIDAEMKNGLLTLELPRKEKEAPLSIKVKG